MRSVVRSLALVVVVGSLVSGCGGKNRQLNDPEAKPNQSDLDICEGMVDDIARKRCIDAAYDNRRKDLEKAEKARSSK